jgi:hypothetical protein
MTTTEPRVCTRCGEPGRRGLFETVDGPRCQACVRFVPVAPPQPKAVTLKPGWPEPKAGDGGGERP